MLLVIFKYIVLHLSNVVIACKEHGTIYAISSDFGDRMTTQHLE